MKRTIYLSLILTILLAALCGCSAKAEYPSSEEVREIIPAEISVDLSEHLPIIEEARTLEEALRGIPRTFTLDETVWEESFGESDMQFYHRIGDNESNDYICLYEDGDASVSIEEYDAYYCGDNLSDVFFKDSQVSLYLDTDYWHYNFDREDLHYIIEYNYDNEFIRAFVSHADDGLDFRYENGSVTDLYYSVRIKSDALTESFDGYYTDDGKLESIYYYAYPNDDSLFGTDLETTYDNNYFSEDAPAEQPAAEEMPAEQPAVEEIPAETQTPEATENPEKTPKPARTGFFGKVLDEIEKDFGNIKQNIVEDFQ